MRAGLSNPVLKAVAIVLGLALIPAWAQAPTEKPAAQSQAGQSQDGQVRAKQVQTWQVQAPQAQPGAENSQANGQANNQPNGQANNQPNGQPNPQANTQPKSQPGAQGQALAETQPPVPVPPGPVPPEQIKPAPPTPIAVKKIELGSENTWDPQWDVLIEENLPSELLSPDMAHAVRPFCPRFGQLDEADKRAFWAYLFQALAGAEAGLKPTADVRHKDPSVAVPDQVSHRIVRQQGLLQLTYEDSVRYGCNFDWDKDKHLRVGDPDKTILQPENNLLCGLHIMKNQLIDLNRPLVTSKSYWGTLRPGTISYRVFAKQMANVPIACGARTAPRHKSLDRGLREASVTSASSQPVRGAEQ